MRKTLSKIRVFFIAVLCLLTAFVVENSYAKDRYSMNGNGAWSVINEHDLCRHVRNNGSRIVYIPTATRDEWRSFINNPPANVVVQQCVYEYTDWADWGMCSVECGGGNQGRARSCELYGTPVDCSYCGGECNETQACNTMACQTHKWVTGNWGNCTEQCGNNTQTRDVYCERTDYRGVVTRVASSNCPASQMPESTKPCSSINCSYDWDSGPWSSCSATCGGGVNTRQVWCEQTKQGVKSTVADSRCNAAVKPNIEQVCGTNSCFTYRWDTTDWGTCSSTCGLGQQSRGVICLRSDGVSVADSFCTGSKPPPYQNCSSSATCSYSWSATNWDKCSNTCGTGQQKRSVSCVSSNGVVVADSFCSGSKLPMYQTCSDTSTCTYSWNTTNWGSCNASCGTGQQQRSVSCVSSSGGGVVDSFCSGAGPKPPMYQSCNTGKECIDRDDYDWSTTNWGSCTNGKQTRDVWCRKDSTEKRVSDGICAQFWPKPAAQRECTAKSCTLDGVTIPHGGKKIFYKERSLSAPFKSCETQYRTCNDGQLGGSANYQYKSCSDPYSYQWVMGDWLPCSKCGATQQRELHCQASNGQRGATSSKTCGNPPTEATRSCQTGCAPTITCNQRDFDFDGWCQPGRTQCSNFNFNQIFCSGQPNCTVRNVRTLTNSCAFCRVQAEVCSSGGSGSVTTPTLPKGPWTTGSWGSCSQSCGGGTQTRNVSCNYSGGCNGAKPATSQSCNTQACSSGTICADGGRNVGRTQYANAALTLLLDSYGCDCGAVTGGQYGRNIVCAGQPGGISTFTPQPKGPWQTGSWGSCNKSCGGGVQYRSVSCNTAAGCVGSAPSSSRSCNTQACALPKGPWTTGGWSGCNKSCGGGVQTRSVSCSYAGGCTGSKPSASQSCNTQSCGSDSGNGGLPNWNGGNDPNDWMRNFKGYKQIY